MKTRIGTPALGVDLGIYTEVRDKKVRTLLRIVRNNDFVEFEIPNTVAPVIVSAIHNLDELRAIKHSLEL